MDIFQNIYKLVDKYLYLYMEKQNYELDKKDFKIIDELKQDSRSTIKEIAKKTKIRPSTVHQRIKKLLDNEVIEKFTVKLSNLAVGESFVVFVLVKADHEIERTFFESPHVKEVFGITGEYDLLMKLKFADINDFNEFILHFRKHNHVTLTMVATTIIKEEI